MSLSESADRSLLICRSLRPAFYCSAAGQHTSSRAARTLATVDRVARRSSVLQLYTRIRKTCGLGCRASVSSFECASNDEAGARLPTLQDFPTQCTVSATLLRPEAQATGYEQHWSECMLSGCRPEQQDAGNGKSIEFDLHFLLKALIDYDRMLNKQQATQICESTIY